VRTTARVPADSRGAEAPSLSPRTHPGRQSAQRLTRQRRVVRIGRSAGRPRRVASLLHPGGNPGANLKSISHRCHPILVAFLWELTKETIDLPLGCPHSQKCRTAALRGEPPPFCTVRSFLRLIDSCITQLKAQGPSRTCNEGKEEGAPR